MLRIVKSPGISVPANTSALNRSNQRTNELWSLCCHLWSFVSEACLTPGRLRRGSTRDRHPWIANANTVTTSMIPALRRSHISCGGTTSQLTVSFGDCDLVTQQQVSSDVKLNQNIQKNTIRTKHNMRIFGVITFIKLQNETLNKSSTAKNDEKIIRKTRLT